MGEHVTHPVGKVTRADFDAAMVLLGVDNADPERALVSVVISEGRITATYAQINHVVSFAEALLEPPHGRVGANEAVDEANCHRMYGMSLAQWRALPEPSGDWDE